MRWFRRSEGSKPSRLLFTTDLHGSERCFRKLMNAAKIYEAQTVIIGGDLTGKALVPILASGGAFEASFEGRIRSFASEEEVAAFERVARDAGYYPYRCDRDTFDEMQATPGLVDELFIRLMQEMLRGWVALAQERLVSQGIRFMLNCGNDDPFALDAILEEAEGIEFLEGRVVPLENGCEVVSVGYANMTPWNCHRDIPEDELAARIDTAVAGVEDISRAIFNVHCPPYNSSLDTAPHLDETLRPVMIGGVMDMVPVGSTAVRQAIEKYQPMLSLHGHIHESRGATRMGRTLVINPGSEYPEGVLRAAIIDLEPDKVKNYLLVAA